MEGTEGAPARSPRGDALTIGPSSSLEDGKRARDSEDTEDIGVDLPKTVQRKELDIVGEEMINKDIDEDICDGEVNDNAECVEETAYKVELVDSDQTDIHETNSADVSECAGEPWQENESNIAATEEIKVEEMRNSQGVKEDADEETLQPKKMDASVRCYLISQPCCDLWNIFCKKSQKLFLTRFHVCFKWFKLSLTPSPGTRGR